MKKQRVSHLDERVLAKNAFRYSRFKVSFYSKCKLEDDSRKLIKFLNSMQGS